MSKEIDRLIGEDVMAGVRDSSLTDPNVRVMEGKSEAQAYFSLFHGIELPLSSFHQPGILEVIKIQVKNGKLIGKYDLDGNLIIFDPHPRIKEPRE